MLLAIIWPAMVMGVLGDGGGSFAVAVLTTLVLYGCGIWGGLVGITRWRREKHRGKATIGLVTGIIALGLAGLLTLGMLSILVGMLVRSVA